MINIFDLKKQYEGVAFSSFMKIRELIMNGQFVGGEALDEFEENFANYNKVKHCVGVGSGTDALILALKSLGVGPGDEVIVPANTYVATPFAVSHVGATPVFVDVDSTLYNVSVDDIRGAVTKKTKAVIIVHLYGNPVDVLPILNFTSKNNLYLIEDCAQAAGAEINGNKVGSFGDASCFSFYPTKNLGGIGQGGAVLTDNDAVAKKVREYGNVGRKTGSWYEYDVIGYNSRLDSINAVFLNECLFHLDEWNDRRIELANIYYNLLNAGVPFSQPRGKHVYHLFEYKCKSKEDRNKLIEYLKLHNVGTGLHYPIPCHKQPVYKDLGYELPVSESLSDVLLSIPMNPMLTENAVDYIARRINQFRGE